MIGSEVIERVDRFIFLGSLISPCGLVCDEIPAWIQKARLAFTKLRHLWSRRDIRLSTEGRSVLLYVSETWTLSPTNATLTGQPILTITGRNLGRSVSDIVDVFLDLQSKIQCIVLPETYQRSHKFMCKLVTAPHLSLPVSGKLKVVISNKRYEAFSPVFHFAVPHLIHATPHRGPKAGGTRLYLSGTNLNIGRQRAVYLYLPTVSGTIDESYQDRFSESDVHVKCEIEQ
ncbi:unnamed protein product [Schistosoma mattheei]|uniref:Uncharacterized protein n=1 Tax=Schistosoma mattheei TaxID=31246 RepID=A0A183Q226_9TREM|nr:unnamed protein product [Schistosoma mattheei]